MNREACTGFCDAHAANELRLTILERDAKGILEELKGIRTTIAQSKTAIYVFTATMVAHQLGLTTMVLKFLKVE